MVPTNLPANLPYDGELEMNGSGPGHAGSHRHVAGPTEDGRQMLVLSHFKLSAIAALSIVTRDTAPAVSPKTDLSNETNDLHREHPTSAEFSFVSSR